MTKNEIEIKVAEVVDYLRITDAFLPNLRKVVERKITADAAKKQGLKVSNQELQKVADAFRSLNGLTTAKETEKWLATNSLSLESFEEFFETNILISKFKDFLEQKAGKTKYSSRPEVKGVIQDLIYRDWLAKNLD
jgi:FKBP-type peptidyl-prolyl cis-trans isomerase (trigger factor)